MVNSYGEIKSIFYIIIFSFLVTSCVQKVVPGTKTPYGQDSLTKIKKIGVLVKVDEDFSVIFEQARSFSHGLSGISPLGAVIESGIRSNADTKFRDEIKPLIGEYNITNAMYESIMHNLQIDHVFSSIEKINKTDENMLRRKDEDGILEINIKRWGVARCSESEKKVRIFFNIHAKIFSFESGGNVLEHNRIYAHGECYLREDLQSREGLLRTILTEAVAYVSQRVVDEIHFP